MVEGHSDQWAPHTQIIHCSNTRRSKVSSKAFRIRLEVRHCWKAVWTWYNSSRRLNDEYRLPDKFTFNIYLKCRAKFGLSFLSLCKLDGFSVDKNNSLVLSYHLYSRAIKEQLRYQGPKTQIWPPVTQNPSFYFSWYMYFPKVEFRYSVWGGWVLFIFKLPIFQ